MKLQKLPPLLKICIIPLVMALTLGLILSGCQDFTSTGADPEKETIHDQTVPASGKPIGSPRDNQADILEPQASGVTVFDDPLYHVDVSNLDLGYLMVQYLGDNPKVMVRVTVPDGSEYKYLVQSKEMITYPLTGGDGTYQIALLESTDIANNNYALSFTQTLDVTITDEFSPFLRPNTYVNFAKGDDTVSLGEELADQCYSDLEVIENIYAYVVQNINYDHDLAASGDVKMGYLADNHRTLETKKGICFDFASLMASMLRSQRIPTKLVWGYAGEAYHAWISCWVDEIGWVENVIQFDGKDWTLMDPTFAATSSKGGDLSYVGDGQTYVVSFCY